MLPIWIFDASIDFLQWLADIFQNEQLENAAELGRIGKYYAVEDMVETENRYGKITLQDYFNRIAVEGQEYDPYTSMYVSRSLSSRFCICLVLVSMLILFRFFLVQDGNSRTAQEQGRQATTRSC